MAIKFLCPNGHPLSCGEDRAGKPGKCPKCGTQFVVPDAEEIAAAASNGATERGEAATVTSGSAVGGAANVGGSAGSGKSSAVGPGSGVGQHSLPPVPADHIVFLCPNGHRLNGPKSLQGRPGQCPHCGEKFRIPVYDEEPPQEPLEELEEELEEFPTEEFPTGELPDDELLPEEEEIPVGLAVENDPNEESEAVETFPEEVEIVDGPGVATPTLVTAAAPPIPPLPPGPSHQLFDVFSRLWSLKPKGTTVEIVFKDGKALSPVKYSPALSRQSFGVFAVTEDDESFCVVTVAWDAVARIEFRNLSELPPGVFS